MSYGYYKYPNNRIYLKKTTIRLKKMIEKGINVSYNKHESKYAHIKKKNERNA